MPPWLFWFLAALAIISALGVVAQRNPIHSLLALVLTLLDIAALFIGLGAVTVGFLQAIVYAGAIMVLFLFVVWLLNLQREVAATGRHLALKLVGSVAAAALAAMLLTFLAHSPATALPNGVTPDYGSIDELAGSLFSDYLIGFEVTSVLLLAAVVGAIGVARRTPGSGVRARSAPGSEAAR